MFTSLAQKISSQEASARDISNFSILQFFFWSTWAIYGSYLVYYLTYRGYTNMEIGALMSFRTFMEILGPPIIGYICDHFKTRKTVFMICMILMGLIIIPFSFYNRAMIFIAAGLIGFLWSPQQSILDSWILETSPEMTANYGFMRAWGSIGFALVVAVFGVVIENLGWTFHFMSYGILITAVLITAWKIKDNSYNQKHKIKGPEDSKNNLTDESNSSEENNMRFYQLFLNKKYLFILLVTVVLFIPISMIFIYLAPIIQATGGTSRHLGYALFFNALSEAPVFFAGKKIIKKFKTKHLLLISSVFYLLRIIITSQITAPEYFVFFGLFQSVSYGLFLISIRHYVKMIAPTELQTTAQSIVLMAAFGLGGITASLLGGFLIDNYGMNVMFNFCITVSFLAILLLLSSLLFKHPQKHQSP